MVPAEYHDLGTVFSQQCALSLPPHFPYNCGIDLLPGQVSGLTSLPWSRLYDVSWPERESLEKYISESLTTGLILPPTGEEEGPV